MRAGGVRSHRDGGVWCLVLWVTMPAFQACRFRGGGGGSRARAGKESAGWPISWNESEKSRVRVSHTC